MIIQSRFKQFGWLAVLAICLGLFIALSFQTHSVKTEVLLAERKIIALERETGMLETEFQTRASQRQLSDWNAVEFGYRAPRADQYLENERHLASLGSPVRVDAPPPIRVARNVPSGLEEAGENDLAEIAMVSPITGKPVTLSAAERAKAEASLTDDLGELLAQASPVKPAQAAEASGPIPAETVGK
jgi:hypothetical protein